MNSLNQTETAAFTLPLHCKLPEKNITRMFISTVGFHVGRVKLQTFPYLYVPLTFSFARYSNDIRTILDRYTNVIPYTYDSDIIIIIIIIIIIKTLFNERTHLTRSIFHEALKYNLFTRYVYMSCCIN